MFLTLKLIEITADKIITEINAAEIPMKFFKKH